MIYATGDLHGNTLRFQPQYFPEQAEMTKDDYMIVCGDAGLVWNGDKSDDPQLDRLETLPFTVLFVDGNHENFDALNEYPVEQWHGGKVHKIRPHVIHLMRGQAFELQGARFSRWEVLRAMISRTGFWTWTVRIFTNDMTAYAAIVDSSASTTFHGGRKNCRPTRNMPKPGRCWSGWTGRSITSSRTAHRQQFSRKSTPISSRIS